MSQQYYIKKWDAAQEALNNVINLERPIKPEPEAKTLKEAFNMVCARYVQYIGIYKRLAKCYDYMVHPQKRKLIGRCMDGVTGRIVELRQELFKICASEYAGFGHFCLESKILPSDTEMEFSQTFHYEKMQRLKHRKSILENILSAMEKTKEQEYTVPAKLRLETFRRPLTSIPQSANISLMQFSSQMDNVSHMDIPCKDFGRKVVNWKLVQNMFKIYQSRLFLDSKRDAAEVFMNLRYKGKSKKDLERNESKIVIKRILAARDKDEVYAQRLAVANETIKESAAARNMEEDIHKNIMQWILECREATGSFPDYPGDDIGGSAAIFALKTPEEVQDELDYGNENLKTKPKPKDKPKKSKKGELQTGYTMMESKFIDEPLIFAAVEYDIYWKNKDESDNFHQEMSNNLLNEHVIKHMESALRQQIDERMRMELDLMKVAVDKQKIAKIKPKKPKPEKKKKNKKDKKKKLKDLTPNANVDDLYSELVMNGVIRKASSVSLKSFAGEVNLMSEAENGDQECKPDLGDIRKMIFDFVLLPLSNAFVHERAPYIKSLMIAGPRGSGKKLLVHAACNELGANLFDMTGENLRGKYVDVEDQQMLMHMVMKVGKLLEPSIIFIGDCELMFTKKLPPDMMYNPARMKSNITKALKTIGPEDRIMLIGTTSRPYTASKGPLFKMYERLIFIYPPTYVSRYAIWESTITSGGGIVSKSEILSTLAQFRHRCWILKMKTDTNKGKSNTVVEDEVLKISSNFTARDIGQVVQEILTTIRIKRQAGKPLNAAEFGKTLSHLTPIYTEELKTLVNWLKDTPLFKHRQKIQAFIEAGKNVFDFL